jgi:hypothetical protein
VEALADNYTEHWRRYKKARNIFWFVFISYVPGVFAISWAVSKLGLPDSTLPVALAWMAAFAITGARVNMW